MQKLNLIETDIQIQRKKELLNDYGEAVKQTETLIEDNLSQLMNNSEMHRGLEKGLHNQNEYQEIKQNA